MDPGTRVHMVGAVATNPSRGHIRALLRDRRWPSRPGQLARAHYRQDPPFGAQVES